MDVDEVDDENVFNNSVQPSPEKTNIRKDVGPDVETPLGQQDKHDEGSDTPKENELGLRTTTEKGVLSEDTAVKTTSEEEKEYDVETDHEEERPIVKDQEEPVNVDNMDSDDIPLGKRYDESVSKRLWSNSRKVVASEAETSKKSGTRSPKSRIKTTVAGPKRGSSKVKVKLSAEGMRKRNVVSSSESDRDAAEDVPNITPSTSRKSAGKKIVQTVDNVPIYKVSFHLPANALRWKYIFHRRLELERELGKEAVKMTDVMDMIKKAGLLKTVCNLGNYYEKLVKEF